MRELRGLKRGTLRLGLPPIGSDMLFAPLFADYRRRYPDITVQLVEHGSDQLEQLLRDGSIDLAGLLLPASSDFDFRWVQKEPLVVILPFDHPLADQASVTMLDLQREAFILFENSFSLHRIILEACRKEKFEPAVVATSSQIDFVIELVSSGLGIAFLPQTIARQRAHAKVKAVLLSQADAEWQMVMAWRRNGYLSEAATAWLRLLKDEAE
ncbi:MAG TPA: LysR substrate-binding domain-containing protein [Sphingobium sp.]|uniref:LysR substrate-binding domain-containing protein n=1 Tax=Sphingobium sp. TaxID=1912891 RepID=UPI002ED5C463